MIKGKEFDFFRNFLKDVSPKMSFALGLLVGIAIFSTVGFVLIYSVFFRSLKAQDVSGQKQEAAVQAPSDNAAAQPTDNKDNSEKIDVSKLSPVTKSDHIEGNFNAPVTMVLFTDFQCPYCAKHGETVRRIAQDYKDQVRIVLRQFPLGFHDQAEKAAEASECASEQGKFWEMHDQLFIMNEGGTMSVDNFKKAAADLGLKTDQFNQCLDSGKYAAKVQADYQEGLSVGVQGTPTTIVDGKLIPGALPYDQFKQIIDSELQK